MNTRSLRFRLIGLYAGLLALVVLAFGAYTYQRLGSFLREVQANLLEHRAQQIAQNIVAEIPARGESYVGAEIEARYAPAFNDKFVRVTRPDGSLLYLGGAPNDRSFTPENVPALFREKSTAATREQPLANGRPLLIATMPSAVASREYLVEVGTSLANSERVLRALLLALAAGLPVVMGVAIFGGYVLMKRALTPVQNIMRAAQDITLHHLSRRLPVSEKGDEIASLSIALNQMIARLDESFQNASRFTADASHELRTPLAIIHGELEAILLGKKLEPELRDALASLLEEVERLVRIVEGLFALSRLDTGEAQTERVRFNLAQLAETTAEQMCLLAEEKQIDLVCQTREPAEIEGDRARVKQVIVNLLDNAIKYTPQNGRIALTVRGQNGSALLEVTDTGPGVSAAALPHLFERFYRADEVRSREIGGAGIGLSIVHSICAAHGGSVNIKNADPTGCQVTVELPKATHS
jgi:heavy metal sensor kinase